MRDGLGTVAVAFLAIACCAGLPLLLVAGVSVAAAAWIGGITLGLAVFAASLALLVLRGRRRAASDAKRQEALAQPRHPRKQEVQIR